MNDTLLLLNESIGISNRKKWNYKFSATFCINSISNILEQKTTFELFDIISHEIRSVEYDEDD